MPITGGGSTVPTQIKKVMSFIDGSNLALRFKALKNGGRRPYPDVQEIKDTFVWRPLPPQYPALAANTIQAYEVIRAYYYTYFTGDYDKISELEAQIKRMRYHKSGSEQTLSPFIIKKQNSQVSAKGDDIALAVEALHHAYNRNADMVHIFTGDGDYLPLVKEIKHLGIPVIISAFSTGRNEKLYLEADYFLNLDDVYFQRFDPPQHQMSKSEINPV